MKTLLYKIGEIVYNAVNEAFDFNDIEDGSNKLDHTILSNALNDTISLNELLSNYYGIRKFPNWNIRLKINGFDSLLFSNTTNLNIDGMKNTIPPAILQNLLSAGFTKIKYTYYSNDISEIPKELQMLIQLIIELYKLPSCIADLHGYMSPDKGLILIESAFLGQYGKLGGDDIGGFAFLTGKVDYLNDDNKITKNKQSKIDTIIKSTDFIVKLLKIFKLNSQAIERISYSYKKDNELFTHAMESSDGYLYLWLLYDANESKTNVKINPTDKDLYSNIYASGLGGTNKRMLECIRNEWDDKKFIQQFTNGFFTVTLTNSEIEIEKLLGPNKDNGLDEIFDDCPTKKLFLKGVKGNLLSKIFSVLKLTDTGLKLWEKVKNDNKVSPKKLKELIGL